MADFFWFRMGSGRGSSRSCRLLRQACRGSMTSAYFPGLSMQGGGRWSDSPAHVYGPKKALYDRFRRWAERGEWERTFPNLAGIHSVPSRSFIDSGFIKVQRTADGAKEGLGAW